MSKSNWTLQECLEREKFYAEGEKKMGIRGYHSNLYDYLNTLHQTKLIMTGMYCVGDITKEEGMQQLVECLKENNEGV